MNYYPMNYWKGWQGQSLVDQGKVDAIGQRYYDTWRVKAGTAVPVTPFVFFSIPLGQQQAGVNFATTYAKDLHDTNLRASGQLPKGHFFRIGSLQVKVTIAGSTDTTYGASGPGTEMPTDPAYAVAVASTNMLEATVENLYLKFRVGTKDYEEGTADLFPSYYGVSGFAGGGADPNISGAELSTFESISNNGFGRPWIFPIPRDVDQLRDFSVIAQFAYAYTPRVNFRIRVILEGLELRPVQ